MPEVSPSKYLVMAGWDNVPHLDAKTKAELLASTPAHLRKARSQGIPALGSGAIFPVDEESIKFNLFPFPAHWPRICGMDFGWDHPTAAAWFAWDRDADTTYLYDTYRVSQKTPVTHAAAIKARGVWIPVAWPADGLQTEKGTGIQLAEQYRGQGLNMLHEIAQLPEVGSEGETNVSRVSVEAGISEMLDAMQIGTFKVAAHLSDWWDEFRLYHRKDGKIVKEADDLMAASRYAYVMRRYAICKPQTRDRHRPAPNWRA